MTVSVFARRAMAMLLTIAFALSAPAGAWTQTQDEAARIGRQEVAQKFGGLVQPGPLADYVYQMVGGIKAGMGYCGTPSIEALRRDARFVRISGASLAESHPHDIHITRESPNYSTEVAGGE